MADELREQTLTAPMQGPQEAPAEVLPGDTPATAEALAEQLGAARAEAAANQEKYLRCRAEMENYRRRVESTYAQLVRESRRELLRRFLDVLDNLERALACGGPPTSADALLEGIELTRKKFLSLLEQEGVRPIPALGQPFDPRRHEAVSTVVMTDADGTVVGEALRGYTVDDDLLRPARVIVATREDEQGTAN